MSEKAPPEPLTRAKLFEALQAFHDSNAFDKTKEGEEGLELFTDFMWEHGAELLALALAALGRIEPEKPARLVVTPGEAVDARLQLEDAIVELVRVAEPMPPGFMNNTLQKARTAGRVWYDGQWHYGVLPASVVERQEREAEEHAARKARERASNEVAKPEPQKAVENIPEIFADSGPSLPLSRPRIAVPKGEAIDEGGPAGRRRAPSTPEIAGKPAVPPDDTPKSPQISAGAGAPTSTVNPGLAGTRRGEAKRPPKHCRSCEGLPHRRPEGGYCRRCEEPWAPEILSRDAPSSCSSLAAFESE